MAFELPPLPYPKNALEPHMSAQTLEFHHGKHHQAYVTNLNNLVKDTPMAKQSFEEIIKATAKDESKATIFNNAAQVWNHTFFWNCMKPGGGGQPSGDVAQTIDATFGGLDKFKQQFKEAATRSSTSRCSRSCLASCSASSSTTCSTPARSSRSSA